MRRKLAAVTATGQYIDLRTDEDRREAEGRIEEMGRLAQAPGLRGTDSINFRGRYNGHPFPNMPRVLQEAYLAEAKALGIDLAGKTYKSGLVRPEFRGRLDPEALVDSTHDVQRRLEERGWGTADDCESMVKVASRAPEVPDRAGPYEVADTIVEKHVANHLASQGVEVLPEREYDDLFDKTKQRLSGRT